jgi:hypothetical protein
MSTKLPLLLALLATADAAAPPLAPHTDQGVTIDVPQDWKVLVKNTGGMHNVTMSAGITTSITMYWYDYAPGATPDIVLDILVGTVHDQLPIGDIVEQGREWIPGLSNPWELVRGKRANAEVTAMGIPMKVGMVTILDQPNGRMAAAFLVAPPETYQELGGTQLLTDVVASFRLQADPPLPTPAWYWDATPPDAIARAVATVADAGAVTP